MRPTRRPAVVALDAGRAPRRPRGPHRAGGGRRRPRAGTYFDLGETGVRAGGVRTASGHHAQGTFNVWTKRFGNGRIKVLLLHGGPAATHVYFEAAESYFPAAGIEFYEYDQLGSYYSDQPTDDSLWTTERFVDEVEQVRRALGLEQFYLLGHSWGGILARSTHSPTSST